MEPPSGHPLRNEWLHWNHLVHFNQYINPPEYQRALQKRAEIEAQVAQSDPAMSPRVTLPAPVVQPAAGPSVADQLYTQAAARRSPVQPAYPMFPGSTDRARQAREVFTGAAPAAAAAATPPAPGLFLLHPPPPPAPLLVLRVF